MEVPKALFHLSTIVSLSTLFITWFHSYIYSLYSSGGRVEHAPYVTMSIFHSSEILQIFHWVFRCPKQVHNCGSYEDEILYYGHCGGQYEFESSSKYENASKRFWVGQRVHVSFAGSKL